MEDQLTYRSEEVIVGIQRMEEETQQEPTQTHPERNRCTVIHLTQCNAQHLPDDVLRINFFYLLGC